MGRYLFRRASLVAIMVGLGTAAGTTDGPLPPLRGGVPTGIETENAYFPPNQGHAAKKTWSSDFAGIIAERSEVAFWLERWSDNEGLEKIRQSRSRISQVRSELLSILRNAGIPWELTAIPIVESNWRSDAVSSSGAAGPWQFLESSGRGRSLIIDSWRDERRDYWKSTEAAAAELNFHYRLFDDWSTAIAAYNAGPTRMRELRDKGDYSGFWTMLDAGVIPRETRSYVPQVLAVSYVEAHAGRLGLPIEWKAPLEWTLVSVNRSIHLGLLAETLGLNRVDLVEAHPELLHPVTPPPNSDYQLKVSRDLSNDVNMWLTVLEESDAPRRFWRYTVKSGDTLSGIAANSGVSLQELLRYNDHIDIRMLRIGERLYLPGRETAPVGVEPDRIPEWPDRYRVKPGDSLWSIALDYGISPEILAEVNHRSIGGILTVGSELKVPTVQEEQ